MVKASETQTHTWYERTDGISSWNTIETALEGIQIYDRGTSGFGSRSALVEHYVWQSPEVSIAKVCYNRSICRWRGRNDQH